MRKSFAGLQPEAVCVNAFENTGVSRVYVTGSFLLHGRKSYSGWRDEVNVKVTAEIFTEWMGEEGSEERSAYYLNETEVSPEEYETDGFVCTSNP